MMDFFHVTYRGLCGASDQVYYRTLCAHFVNCEAEEMILLRFFKSKFAFYWHNISEREEGV